MKKSKKRLCDAMLWLILKDTMLREIILHAVSLIFGIALFGLLGVELNDMMETKIIRQVVWSAIGFVFIKFFLSLIVVLAREYDRLKKHSIRDPLTGLYNNSFLSDAIQLTYANARRNNEYFCVFVIDVDKLKNINDTYGHPAGDQALVKIATILNEAVYRRNDFVIRYGGDEFIIICSSRNPDKMFLRVKNTLELENNPAMKLNMESASIYITASTGNAARLMDRSTAPEESAKDIFADLYREADVSMYAAKRGFVSQLVA